MFNEKITRTFLGALLIISTCLLTGCWTTKSGQKSGIIVKVAKEGRYWGTWEGELIRGGLEDASGATGKSFNFTLGQFRTDLVTKAEHAMQNNSHVVIYYKCEEFVFPWRGETKCFIKEINILKNLDKKIQPKITP